MNPIEYSDKDHDSATRERLALLARYRQLQVTFERERHNAVARQRLLQLRAAEQHWDWLAL